MPSTTFDQVQIEIGSPRLRLDSETKTVVPTRFSLSEQMELTCDSRLTPESGHVARGLVSESRRNRGEPISI